MVIRARPTGRKNKYARRSRAPKASKVRAWGLEGTAGEGCGKAVLEWSRRRPLKAAEDVRGGWNTAIDADQGSASAANASRQAAIMAA